MQWGIATHNSQSSFSYLSLWGVGYVRQIVQLFGHSFISYYLFMSEAFKNLLFVLIVGQSGALLVKVK